MYLHNLQCTRCFYLLNGEFFYLNVYFVKTLKSREFSEEFKGKYSFMRTFLMKKIGNLS